MSAFRLDNNHMASRVYDTDPGVFPGSDPILSRRSDTDPGQINPNPTNLPRILNRKKDEGDFF